MSGISLKCTSLEKSFLNKVIFKNVTLDFVKGDSVAITGRNGSGKSTLLKVLANLIKPNKGKVEIFDDGKEVIPDKVHMHLGMIAPYINLYDELTAYENLEFFFDLKCKSDKYSDKKERIKYLLDKINLYGRRNDDVKNYSSGMKQRVKLAFAIINDPEILLLDEPRTNLDVEGIDLVYKVAEEQKQKGILILATNEPEDTGLCSRIISIEDYKK
ncbi:MAG: ABC transporter ATP-binding protein [Ignavibacteriota bacterium]|nr:ABC transporter ATP-binding protein [Ignavibacteriota bacterium]